MTGVEHSYRFAIIPEWVLYHPDLSANAVRVYGALARHGMDPATCYPSQERIGKLIGVAPRSVAALIRQLGDVGAVQVVPRYLRGRRTSNGYLLAGDMPLTEPSTYRAPQRGCSEVQPRSPARSYRAPTRAEREPLNETPTYISPESNDAPRAPDPRLLRRLEELKSRRAAHLTEGTPTP